VKFLIDENLARRLASELVVAGHDAVHVSDLGLRSSPDQEILKVAFNQKRILISRDTDFGLLIERDSAGGPSLILIRRMGDYRVKAIVSRVLVLLSDHLEVLTSGGIVVVDGSRERVRRY
jgi:predicted nuclease of predicted toxin-antitoxin system